MALKRPRILAWCRAMKASVNMTPLLYWSISPRMSFPKRFDNSWWTRDGKRELRSRKDEESKSTRDRRWTCGSPRSGSLPAGRNFCRVLRCWSNRLPAVCRSPPQRGGPGTSCSQHQTQSVRLYESIDYRFVSTFSDYTWPDIIMSKKKNVFKAGFTLWGPWISTISRRQSQWLKHPRTYSSTSCPSTSWTPLSDFAMSPALLSTWTQSTFKICKRDNRL